MLKEDWRQQLCPGLGAPLAQALTALPDAVADSVLEVRLRAGQTPAVRTASGELPLQAPRFTGEMLAALLAQLSRYSLYAHQNQLAQGFLTLQGGFRLGVAGAAVVRDGAVVTIAQPATLNLRIARQLPDCARALYDRLFARGLCCALLLSSPGMGKTTCLRDLVRLLSQNGRRVALCDERGEIASLYRGTPQLDVGPHTDVMSDCPKAQAITRLLRSMAPELVAVDELGSAQDADALKEAALCGVKVLATAHADDLNGARRRKELACLLPAFDRFVVLGAQRDGTPGRVQALYDANGTLLPCV